VLNVDLRIPAPHMFLLTERAPYKGLWGGRGGAKSHSAARALVARITEKNTRVLCGREFQTSIKDSVHYLLCDTIQELGLSSYFDMQDRVIKGINKSEVLYRGIARNIQEIKSMEKLDIVWLEEAANTSNRSLETLIPTIRRDGSELWATWNTINLNDPIHEMFVTNKRPDAIAKHVNWNDNPFLPAKLDAERRYMLANDPDAYDHVWQGAERKVTAATIFRGKYEVTAFETPTWARFFHGADWGFADDPTVLIRSFMGPDLPNLMNPELKGDESCLYIDKEAYAHRIEMEEIPALFNTIPNVRQWPIYADSARPESISYVARNGNFNIHPSEKWEGCVEDGIEHLRAFKKIYIHQSCTHMHEEARLYSFKVDPKDDRVILPIVVDKHNHCWDAVRYSLGPYIQRRGNLSTWAKLTKRRVAQVAQRI
jgi:phage terminase large subunit